MKSISAKQITKLRKGLGLTQVEFGKKLGVTGSSVGNWETEECVPRAAMQERLAKMYVAKIGNGLSHAKVSKTKSGNRFQGKDGHGTARGGRHKMSVEEREKGLSRFTEVAGPTLVRLATDTAANEYDLPPEKFRRALCVALTCLEGQMSIRDITSFISGHK
jgi:transcriptional regulator with XRE-family HTH domain